MTKCNFARQAHRWSLPCRLLPKKDLVAYCQFCFTEKLKRWDEKNEKYWTSFPRVNTYFALQFIEAPVELAEKEVQLND